MRPLVSGLPDELCGSFNVVVDEAVLRFRLDGNYARFSNFSLHRRPAALNVSRTLFSMSHLTKESPARGGASVNRFTQFG
jgi:hypothetical protein